jgi:glycosyltransferase involved in cell wall biosynthesis
VLIIGEGPQQKELEDLVEKKDLKSRISFTGFQTKIEPWMSALDVFVLPSLTEGLPMALLEAMAFGVPVVASAVGGVPQLIKSGENGILISAGDPEAIKNALGRLWADISLREELSRKASATIKIHYDVKTWITHIENEYMAAINQSKTLKSPQL